MEEEHKENVNQYNNGWLYGCKHPLFYDPSRKRTNMHRKLASEYTLRMDNEEEQQTKKGKRKLISGPKGRYGRSNTWYIIVSMMTFYLIGPCLRITGRKEKRVQEAFREKVALCKLNFFAMFVIGFIIFGLNDVCCKNTGVQVAYNKLSKSNYISIHGRLYEVEEGIKTLSEIGIRTTKKEIIGRDITSLFTMSDYCEGMSEEDEDDSGSFKCYMAGVRTTGCHEVNSVYKKMMPDGEVYIDMKSIRRDTPFVIYNGIVLDMRLWEENQELVGKELYNVAKSNVGRDITRVIQSRKNYRRRAKCIVDVLRIASIDKKTSGCVFSQAIVMISFIFIIGTVGIRFAIAVYFHIIHSISFICNGNKLNNRHGKNTKKKPNGQFDDNINNYPIKETKNKMRKLQNTDDQNEPITRPHFASANLVDSGSLSTLVIVLIPCYSENEEGIRATLEGLASSEYPTKQICIFVVSDGIVQGTGNDKPTPDYIKDMMIHDERFYPEGVMATKEPIRSAEWPKAYSYIAIASGVYKNNNARVYAGWYESKKDNDRRIPMIHVAKVGNEIESANSKAGNKEEVRSKMPGNRGKRDSQVLLLSLLSKIIFDERMTELEIDIFHKMWTVTERHPGNYEALLMVDADTIVYPKALPNLVATLENDKRIMGVCGETKILKPWQNMVTMIQVYEYYLSHHLSKAFESFFGNVTCLPGCFSMYRIKCPKKKGNYWVPVLTNPDILEKYSESVVETLHQKNLLLLGEDRYLTTLLLKTFPKRHNVFVPSAICRTNVPNTVSVLLSQRRRWVNSTIHNLMELLLIRDLCGIFCFSMQFMVAMEFIGSVTLPAATGFTIYLVVNSSLSDSPEVLPLILLAAILGLPVFLMLITVRKAKYVIWFIFYLIALPFWQIVVPLHAFWHFDDFTWGDTRKVIGNSKGGLDHSRSEGYFDHSSISLKRWTEWLIERNNRYKYEGDLFSSNVESSTLLMTTDNFSTSPRGLAMGNSLSSRHKNPSDPNLIPFSRAYASEYENTISNGNQPNMRRCFDKYSNQTLCNDALLDKFIKNFSINYERTIQ